MSEQNKLKEAMDLALIGKREEAAALLTSLEPVIKEPNLRLQLIDACLSTLSSIKDNEKLIQLASEAIDMTKRANLGKYQAYFMGRKADLLSFQVGIRHHRMASLKLTPRWINFATEAEETEYNILLNETNEKEKELNSLLEGALILANNSGDKKTLAYLLMERGGISSSRYLQHKADSMKSKLYGKLWLKFPIIRYPLFEHLFGLLNKDVRKLPVFVNSFRKDLLESGRLFEEIEEPIASSAYFNLAIYMKSSFRFSEAKKFLRKSHNIALRHNDLATLAKIKEMEKSIELKNEDTPQYLSEEY